MVTMEEKVAVLEFRQKSTEELIQKNFDRLFNWQENHNGVHKTIDEVLILLKESNKHLLHAEEVREDQKTSFKKGYKLVLLGSVLTFISSLIIMFYSLSLADKYTDKIDKITKELKYMP